jgi:hypothetical protein
MEAAFSAPSLVGLSADSRTHRLPAGGASVWLHHNLEFRDSPLIILKHQCMSIIAV